jgi:hypothetical protein
MGQSRKRPRRGGWCERCGNRFRNLDHHWYGHPVGGWRLGPLIKEKEAPHCLNSHLASPGSNGQAVKLALRCLYGRDDAVPAIVALRQPHALLAIEGDRVVGVALVYSGNWLFRGTLGRYHAVHDTRLADATAVYDDRRPIVLDAQVVERRRGHGVAGELLTYGARHLGIRSSGVAYGTPISDDGCRFIREHFRSDTELYFCR